MHNGVDWKEAPKGAKWRAINGSGHAHWYMTPDVAAQTDFWFAEEVPAPTFGYTGNWRDSRTERPGK